MSGPRCWLCNRRMRFSEGRYGYKLHCGPCAATYMDTDGEEKDKFLADYARFYREQRGNGQLSLFD